MVMKTQWLRLLSLLFLTSIISCEKSTEADLEALTMELESCKPDKKKLYIGMEYQGGIIYFLDETGKHGGIVAKEDVGPAPWGCYGTSIPGLSSVDSKTANKILLSQCKEPGTAVRLCAAYEVREKGDHGRVYKDWYMAGLGDYGMIIRNLKRSSNMCGKSYWTFIEMTEWQARPVDPSKVVVGFSVSCTLESYPEFGYGFFFGPYPKKGKVYARPIRNF
jgi:hypothetical protein